MVLDQLLDLLFEVYFLLRSLVEVAGCVFSFQPRLDVGGGCTAQLPLRYRLGHSAARVAVGASSLAAAAAGP